MKLAILSDIHANREALTACLAHAQRQGCDGFVFLGDLVGYGADPHACLDIVRRHAENGAIVVRGNHDDAALGGLCEDMNFEAREATYWTRQQLSAEERDFLDHLPYAVEQPGRLFVHASAAEPTKWAYIASQKVAERCLAATHAGSVFVGHVHHPSLYFSVRNQVMAFMPQPGVPVSMTPGRRWLVIAGSVGQPRDGNPAAAYLTFDVVRSQATFYRVPYDWMSAAAKIRAAGLPDVLATRLEHGQ
jgi:diadenosine tetraphosphatase ApaH/serine/threonine PP2A family protein phosphatase